MHWRACVVASLLSAAVIPAMASGGETQYLLGPRRDALLEHLRRRSEQYDAQAKLILNTNVHVRDHTKRHGKPSHPTRSSIGYAIDLLEANDAEHRKRAFEVIGKVISLQDTNRGSLTYGLWPWYAEEPLGEMFMVDYNWAAFIGKALLCIVIYHEHQLPADLRADVRQAIRRACVCIQRRPLHVGYTNIAAMSSYVTLVAGEQLDDPKLLKYGRWLFDKWYDYTMLHGSFTEYNSPTYTDVAISVVSRMMAHVRDPERRAKAEKLNYMLWHHKARRFHAPTLQWAGPHSRSYGQLHYSRFGDVIKLDASGKVSYAPPKPPALSIGNCRGPRRPPADLGRYIKPLTEPREVMEVFFKPGHPIPNGFGNIDRSIARIPLVGTTYLHPLFCLGTVNYMDFWEQHRNLIAYWGTREATSYLTMRCRNGERGFCSAFMAGVQHRGDVLAGVCFATDHGNRYIDVDPLPNQTLKTDSLRVEFEFGGSLGQADIPRAADLETPFVVSDRRMRISIRYLGGTFAGQEPSVEVRRRSRRVMLAVHLYKGPKKAFHLPTLAEAACLFVIRMTPASDTLSVPEPRVTRSKGELAVKWTPGAKEIGLRLPSTPRAKEELQKRIHTTIGGTPVREIAKRLPAVGSK